MYKGTSRIATHTTATDIVKYATTGTTTMTIGDLPSAEGGLDGRIDGIRLSSIARYDPTDTTITTETLINDADVVYLNTFTGANGTTPTLNTES